MYKVGILGVTGIVGQQLLSLLIDHPFFHIHTISASSKNVGKRFSDVSNISSDHHINNLVIKPSIPTFFSDCHFVFSCLQSDVSYDIEKQFLEYGFLIFSNCQNYRLHSGVPLVVPTVNSSVLNSFDPKLGISIITNANCSTTGIVTVLKPLDVQFGIKRVIITTLQSISGAGKYFDEAISDNVIPFIQNEEEKITRETLKILHKTNDELKISATCNRVPVQNGHTICMSIEFATKPTVDEVINCLQSYNSYLTNLLQTPSSINKTFIKVLFDKKRPQPLLDVNTSDGFCVTVGRIRKCDVFDIKLTLHFNNLVIGAAASALLNAEIYYNLAHFEN